MIARLLLLSLIAAPISLLAQEPAPAEPAAIPAQEKTVVQETIENARKRTGRQIVRIIEMSAMKATPMPKNWTLLFHDPASPNYLSILRAGERAAPAHNLYANGTPPTYFDLTRVKVDVADAFRVTEELAQLAKVGFDDVDYSLRAREFSQEPIWTLRLNNKQGNLMGMVEMSAESARIYRTIWLRRAGGDFKVEDSLLAPLDPAPAKPAPPTPPPADEGGTNEDGDDPTPPQPDKPEGEGTPASAAQSKLATR